MDRYLLLACFVVGLSLQPRYSEMCNVTPLPLIRPSLSKEQVKLINDLFQTSCSCSSGPRLPTTPTSSSSSRPWSTPPSSPSICLGDQHSVAMRRVPNTGWHQGSTCLHWLLSIKVSAEDLAGLAFSVWVISVHTCLLLLCHFRRMGLQTAGQTETYTLQQERILP